MIGTHLYMLAGTPSGWNGDFLESNGTFETDLDARLLYAAIHVEPFFNCKEEGGRGRR